MVEFGEVHKCSIPLQVIENLPFIIIQEKELQPELLKEQWSLIREASELGNLQEMKVVQQKFVQRFHFKHGAVQGMFRFMDDLQHYEAFNPSASKDAVDIPVADSDASSEHYGTDNTPSEKIEAVPEVASVSFTRNSAGSVFHFDDFMIVVQTVFTVSLVHVYS